MRWLTRKQVKAWVQNPELPKPQVTKRQWEALKSFIDSKEEWARDFQPEELTGGAWKEFVCKLERFMQHHSQKQADSKVTVVLAVENVGGHEYLRVYKDPSLVDPNCSFELVKEVAVDNAVLNQWEKFLPLLHNTFYIGLERGKWFAYLHG